MYLALILGAISAIVFIVVWQATAYMEEDDDFDDLDEYDGRE